MSKSILASPLKINGVIDTSKTVGQNLKSLAEAIGVFLVHDVTAGRWNVIVDGIAESIFSVTDKHIIGSISLTSAPFSSMYTAVDITFPNADMGDKRDNLLYSILPNNTQLVDTNTSKNFVPGEYAINQLSMSTDVISDPVVASMMALRTMRKSRFDKVIKFETDFTLIGLKPGDVIDITSDTFGYDKKKFRIINIEETNSDTGAVILSFTCSEYDDSIYDYSDVNRYSLFALGPGNTLTYYNTQLTITSVDSTTPGTTIITGPPIVSPPSNATVLTGIKVGDIVTGPDGLKYVVTGVTVTTLPNGDIQITITGTPYVPGVLDPSNLNAISIPRVNPEFTSNLTPINTNTAIDESNITGAISSGLGVSPLLTFTSTILIANTYVPAPGTPAGSMSTGYTYSIKKTGTYRVSYEYTWAMLTSPTSPTDIKLGICKTYGIAVRNLNTGINIIMKEIGASGNPMLGTNTHTMTFFATEGTLIEFRTYLSCDFKTGITHTLLDTTTGTSSLYTVSGSEDSGAIIEGSLQFLRPSL